MYYLFWILVNANKIFRLEKFKMIWKNDVNIFIGK